MVLTSERRAKFEQREAINERLATLGVPPMIGWTPKLGLMGTRAEEIMAWLGEQKEGTVTHFVALDDWDLEDAETPPVSESSQAAARALRDHFVKTHPDTGLEESHGDEALCILGVEAS